MGLRGLLLVTLVIASAATDVRSRRIYDAFTFPAMLAGILLSLLDGPADALGALGGLAAGSLVLYPFYRIGGMGMGDLKLMAAIGSLGGISLLVSAAVDTALAGGVMALALLAYRGNAVEVLRRSGLVMRALVSRGRRAHLPPAPRADTVPYGVAICAGTLAALFLRWPW